MSDDAIFEINDEEVKLRQFNELDGLFGRDVVEQAGLLDAADLNMNEEMVSSIGNGIRRLSQLRNDHPAQMQAVQEMSAGERLLICMWIMEMNLLEKIGR
jgi:hypothetical protein